jgi:hypothetical protein
MGLMRFVNASCVCTCAHEGSRDVSECDDDDEEEDNEVEVENGRRWCGAGVRCRPRCNVVVIILFFSSLF